MEVNEGDRIIPVWKGEEGLVCLISLNKELQKIKT